MRFLNPIFLLFIPVVALLIINDLKKKGAAMLLSTLSFAKDIKPSFKLKVFKIFKYIRPFTLLLIIFALSRPQGAQKSHEVFNQGVDIMIVLDASKSMETQDFRPYNRFEAAKKVAKDFIRKREYDRIGITVFSDFAFTQCPLTVDLESVVNFVDVLDMNLVGARNTAIGSAIANAASRLEKSEGKSKIIILLTDGRNNMGEIDPITASQAASSLGIKIYTIGVGKTETSVDAWGYIREGLDETTLVNIAEITNGRYFRATDTSSLSKIFSDIDSMEKTKIKTVKYESFTELFAFFLWPAIILLFLELILSNTYFLKVP